MPLSPIDPPRWSCDRKRTPNAEGYGDARDAFHEAGKPLDHAEARDELDRAVRADAALRATRGTYQWPLIRTQVLS
jgi:hypothetical protein